MQRPSGSRKRHSACRPVRMNTLHQTHIQKLTNNCSGNYSGPEPERLATLKFAALLGAPYVDVEFKAAHLFFAGECARH